MSPKDTLTKNFSVAAFEFPKLEQFTESIEHHLKHEENNRQNELQSLPDEQVSIAELFADPFPQTFYASIVIADCILLEQNIDGIAETLKRASGLRLGIADLRGSLIERFRKYSLDILHLEFDLIDDAMWSDITLLYKLRNCLVHRAGQVNKQEDRESAARFNIAIEGNRISLHEADTIVLLDCTWRFIEDVYGSAIRSLSTDVSPH